MNAKLIFFLSSILSGGPHGDKLLARRGVYRYTVIKVRLGGSHLHSHSEALQHLVAAPAHHVETHHLLLLPSADQLHHRLRLPGGHGVIQRRELRLVDLQILLAELLRGFLLSQTNRPDLKLIIFGLIISKHLSKFCT